MKPTNFPARKLARQMAAHDRNHGAIHAMASDFECYSTAVSDNPAVKQIQAARLIRTKKRR